MSGDATRAAILVIHGIGEQQPFQALDAFARGLSAKLGVAQGQLEHRLTWRAGKAQSAIELPLAVPVGRAAATRLDFVEHYWADQVERRIGLSAVLWWLARTSLTPLTNWAQQPAILLREAGPGSSRFLILLRELVRAVVLVAVAALIVLPFVYAAANGPRIAEAGRALWATLKLIRHPVIGAVCLGLAAFALLILRGGVQLLLHRRRPQAWLKPQTARWWAVWSLVLGAVLLAKSAFLYWWFGLDALTFVPASWADVATPPVLLPLVAALFAWVTRGVLIKYVGDIALYVTADERSSFFRTREQVLTGASEHLRTLLMDPQYAAVYVAGHSLGSVIAYDAINRLAREVRAENPAGEPKLSQAELDKLYGLLTFGSPLDKVYYFFRTIVAAQEVIRAQLLASLHGFRQARSGRDYGRFTLARYVIPQPAQFRWLNVYSRLDLVSGRLDFYHVDAQRARPYGNPIGAHLEYWSDPGFYDAALGWL
jgi:hypothetical protein